MKKVRYAVVGLGHIAQAAVLPAFEHARRNSELAAIVSGDSRKISAIKRKYGVENAFGYEDYDACLKSGLIDAVYIALPNALHGEFARRAAQRGIHVLCEKPLTTQAREAERLVEAADGADVRLMTAYRLHFERGNLEAARIARSGQLGELRFFNSSFALQLQRGNIRADRSLGGGPLYDLGVYCVNAARSMFGEDPYEVFAWSSRGKDQRFSTVDEMTGATLRFSDGKLAQFTCSFGAAPVGWYEVAGTKGVLRFDNAYEYVGGSRLEVAFESGRKLRKSFPARDQFAPELLYFSDCVLAGKRPEPDGREGLIDARIIEALLASARAGGPVRVAAPRKHRRPTLRQEMHRPAVGKPRLIGVHSASR